MLVLVVTINHVNNNMKTRQEIYAKADANFEKSLVLSTHLRALLGQGFLSIQNFETAHKRLQHARKNHMSTMFPVNKNP